MADILIEIPTDSIARDRNILLLIRKYTARYVKVTAKQSLKQRNMKIEWTRREQAKRAKKRHWWRLRGFDGFPLVSARR